jgi:hypothetical protein
VCVWLIQKDYYYTFDSIEDLRAILTSKMPVDTRGVREKGPRLWEKMREVSMVEWKDVFSTRIHDLITE